MHNLTGRIAKLERHSAASKDEGILMIVDGIRQRGSRTTM
jgi:hypothetical protein